MLKLKTAALAATVLVLAACGATSTTGTASQLTTTEDSTTTVESTTTPDSTVPDSTTATPTSTADSTSLTTTPHNTGKAKPAVDHQRIALDRVGGGQVTKVERELEHGRTEWKYRILHKGVTYEVRVDAATGAITRFETK